MPLYRVNPARVAVTRQRARRYSACLFAAMCLVLAVIAVVLGGLAGLVITALGVGIVLAVAPKVPPETIMRVYGAQRVSPLAAPMTQRDLRELAKRAQLPTLPQLYLHPGPVIEAVTVGERSHPAIAVSQGAVRALTRRELTAVLAHEVSHICEGDTGLARVAEIIARMTSFLGMFGFILAVLATLTGEAQVAGWLILLFAATPLGISLLQLALSRQREYAADVNAVALTGDPLSLVSALEKIERQQFGVWRRVLTGHGQPMPFKLLQTHPTIAERRAVLLAQLERVDHSRWHPPFSGFAVK